MTEKIKLFKAKSNIDVYENRKDVVFHWYKLSDINNSLNYEELVQGYMQLRDFAKIKFKEKINELFTENEAVQLKNYLKEYQNIETQIREVQFPLEVDSNEALESTFDDNARDYWTHHLYRDKTYCLPFRVNGFYDLNGCEPFRKLSKAEREDGNTFLMRALTEAGVQSGSVFVQFLAKGDEIIQTIYNDINLYVKQEGNSQLKFDQYDYLDYLNDDDFDN